MSSIYKASPRPQHSGPAQGNQLPLQQQQPGSSAPAESRVAGQRSQIFAAAGHGDWFRVWTTTLEVEHDRGQAPWSGDAFALLVDSLREPGILPSPAGHALMGALADSWAVLDDTQKQIVLELAEEAARAAPAPDSTDGLTSTQSVGVMIIIHALGNTAAGARFTAWTEEGFAMNQPCLVDSALTGFRCLRASGADPDSFATPLDHGTRVRCGEGLVFDLNVPYDDFVEAITRYVPPPSVGGGLPAAILARRAAGEALWSDERLATFMSVLEPGHLCPQWAAQEFVSALRRHFDDLVPAQRNALLAQVKKCAPGFRHHGLCDEAAQLVAECYPRATAMQVFREWATAPAGLHPLAVTRLPEMAAEGMIVLDEALQSWKKLTVSLGSIEATSPLSTPMPGAMPAMPAPLDIAQLQTALIKAIQAKDDLAMWCWPWLLLNSCSSSAWRLDVAMLLARAIKTPQVTSHPACTVFLHALAEYLEPARLSVRGPVDATALQLAIEVAESPLLFDQKAFRTPYMAIKLIQLLCANPALEKDMPKTIIAWAAASHEADRIHLVNTVMLAFIACADEGMFGEFHIGDAAGGTCNLGALDPNGTGKVVCVVNLPVTRAYVDAWIRHFKSPQFRMGFSMTSLLAEDALPPTSSVRRDERIRKVMHETFAVIHKMPAAIRLSTLRDLPTAIMRTWIGPELVWNDVRFEQFVKVLNTRRLCAEPGAEAFVKTLRRHFEHLSKAQQNEIGELLRKNARWYDAPDFAAAVTDLVKEQYQPLMPLYAPTAVIHAKAKVPTLAPVPEGKED